MRERRQYFAWVWPKSDPGPLDRDAVQHRWTRLAPRGSLALLALIICSAALACCAAPAALVILTSASEPVRFAVALGLLGVPIAAALWLLLRAWGAGTYVNDAGVKIAGVVRTTIAPWSDVLRIRRGDSSVVLTLRDRGDVTALNAAHPGWWGRADDFDIAALALQRWSESA
jgi:hypothetical protein